MLGIQGQGDAYILLRTSLIRLGEGKPYVGDVEVENENHVIFRSHRSIK